jgi:hypothetical protein
MAIKAGALYKRLNTNYHNSVYVLHIPEFNLYLSTDFVSGISANPIIAKRPVMPRQQVDLLESRTSMGSISIDLINIKNSLEGYIRAGLLDRESVLYQGFIDLPFEQYLPRFAGRISKPSTSRDPNQYQLSIDGRLIEIDKDIFKEESFATEPSNVSSDGGLDAKQWSFVDPDVGTTVTLKISDLDRDGIFETWEIIGNAISAAIAIMISGGDSTRAENAFPPWAGCGIPDTKINLEQWKNAKLTWHPFDFWFILQEGVNVKDFIEQEIMKVFGGYLVISGDGKIGCRLGELPRPTDDLAVFDDTVIQGPIEFLEDKSLLITGVRFSIDYFPNISTDFLTKFPTKCTEKYLDGEYKTEREHYIPSKGLKTVKGGTTVVNVVTAMLFRRFGVAPRRASLESFGVMNLTEAGDHVVIKSDLYPNVDTPIPLGVGAARYAEITNMQLSGIDVGIEAIDLSPQTINGGYIASIIAANGTPDFPDGDKRYAYATGIDGKMDDGSLGYVLS